MPVLPLDDRSVARAIEALRSGSPIVIPAPSPLAYAITGTQAAAVNTAKQRPASQPVGVSVADIEAVAPYLDLAAGTLPLVRWLCESELVSLLVPVRPGTPGWLAPAISGGMVFFTSTPWLDKTATIIDTFGYLYMSSANRTGRQSATTATAAGQAFDKLIVLDGDAWRDQTRPHGSTAMVRLSRDGELAVVRPGISSSAFGADLDAYANDLSRRWRASSQASRDAEVR